VKAIEKKDNRPFWTFSCESCMKCMNNCPHRAIETAHGFTFILWWVGLSSLPYFFMKWLLHYKIVPENIYVEYYELLSNTILLITGLPIIFFGYRILHYLLRFKIINKIITFTSLTHFKFWRRYKHT